MSDQLSMTQLLRWRRDQAASDAPPAPRAASLLEAARPWWETWPERFKASMERLGAMQLSYGYAAEQLSNRSGHPVPTIIASREDIETSARVLYFSVRDDRLRLRFALDAVAIDLDSAYEVAFIADGESRMLLSVIAERSVENEYRLESVLPPELVASWEVLRVTDPMPFRFILRSTLDAA